MKYKTFAESMSFNDSSVDVQPVGLMMPAVPLCELVNDELVTTNAAELCANVRAVVLGVPGAFTPVCTHHHVPEFIANAEGLRALGYNALICIAPDAPWAVQRWAKDVDPQGAIRFLSDGNLEFARKFGLTTRIEDLFLGECSKRYLMTVNEGAIERIRVERRVTDITCTSTALMLSDAQRGKISPELMRA